MPYKSLEDKRKHDRDDKRRKRGTTPKDDTAGTTELVPASYVQGLNGKMHQSLPERPRFLELSDGQVLDRLNQPEVEVGLRPMQACNESAYNFHPRKK